MAYVDLDHVIVTRVIVAPDAGQDRVALEHLTWVHQEEFQQFKLAWCQIYRALVAGHDTCCAIKCYSLECEYIAYVLAMPSEYRPYTSHQFFEHKWLGNVIVRANIQSGNAVLDIFFCRQHDDGWVI